MALWSWSRTAASNASADSSVNWAEGQPPSSVNDSARAMMARTAEYRDDIAGAIVTGGTSTAYTVASYQVFDTLAHMGGMMIAFSPHATNGATVTLNVDGLGAKPLRTAPNTELLAGVLIQGTPYLALYNNSDAAFYLHGFYGNPYNIPLGAGMDFWGTTAPNSSFAFPTGQQISTTTYAGLYAVFGPNRYGTDTGGNFFLPDKTGRVSAMKEAVATRLTTAGSGVDGATMGSAGGAQSKTLVTANLPPYTPAGSITVNSTVATIMQSDGTTDNFSSVGGAGTFIHQTRSGITSTGALAGTAQGGTSTPVAIIPPLILCNYIIRIL